MHQSDQSETESKSKFVQVSDGDCLIGSIVGEEGHIYSLAATNDLLYTGSDSNYIKVWKNLNEFSVFKSKSGLVKAIVICLEGKVFTGHQDGKIRVWKISPKNPRVYTRAGSLPALKDVLKSSVKMSNYVEVRRRRTALWIKHSDAVSCLSLVEDQGLLYSASWDRTVKVWRIHDLKCVESIRAHDDAVNSVVAAVGGKSLVFTGSADGTVKVWKREIRGKRTVHSLVQTLLKQDSAVTALVTSHAAVYGGSSDGAVNFWEMGEKMVLKHGGVFRKHRLAVLCLAAAGNLVFSGSADKKICVWRREERSHTCVSVLSGHTGPVKCLAVAEKDDEEEDRGDRRLVVYSGSLDKSVKVWKVPRH